MGGLARRSRARHSALERLRRGELRLLRPYAPGDRRATSPVEARCRPGGVLPGRGTGRDLCGAALPAVAQVGDGGPGQPAHRGLPAVHLLAGVDEPGHARARPGEAGPVHSQDRLPGALARLLRRRGRARRRTDLGAQRGAGGHGLFPAQADQAGGPRRVAHDAADGQRLLQPHDERDRLSRCDSPAAFFDRRPTTP